MNRLEAIEARLASRKSATVVGVESPCLAALLAAVRAAMGVLECCTVPTSEFSVEGWEGAALVDYGRIAALNRAMVPLLKEASS